MYGKIFESMYDGTIAVNWKAMIVFQQLIVLCDSDGVIDMTPPAISRRTNIPIDVIENGIEFLSEPDKYSRSSLHEGRRIVLVDESRPWGWLIVNHKYYRNLASKEDKKEKDRERISEKRKAKNSIKNNDVAECREQSQMSPIQDTDTDTNTDKEKKGISKKYPLELNVSAWNEFIQYRKEAKIKKLTPSGEKKQIKKLIEFGDYVTQQKCIDESISNGWSGIFPLKNNNGDNNGKRNLSAVEQVEQATRKPAYNL